MTPALIVLAQQIVGVEPSGREFSLSAAHHLSSSAHSVPDVVLVAVGGMVMVVTTIYTLRYLIHPGEAADDHIKRRVLADGYEESR